MPRRPRPLLSRRLLPANPDVSAAVPESEKGSRLTARNQAMNWLGRREYSRVELRVRLAQREYTPAEIDTAVVSLEADGLLSDERFAEAFVAVRRRKGQGPVRIRMELERRGVDDELIRMQLKEVSLEWVSLAREVRRKKFGATMPGDYKEKARQMRFLEYRGFTGEQIRSAVGDDFA
jgi:regulatory protein